VLLETHHDDSEEDAEENAEDIEAEKEDNFTEWPKE